jgi:hypothetical protein
VTLPAGLPRRLDHVTIQHQPGQPKLPYEYTQNAWFCAPQQTDAETPAAAQNGGSGALTSLRLRHAP